MKISRPSFYTTFRVLLLVMFGCYSLALMAEQRYHIVQPGQTLYSIAKAYGVTVEALHDANPNIWGSSIPTGVTLVIPESTRTPESMPLVPEVKNGMHTDKKTEPATPLPAPANVTAPSIEQKVETVNAPQSITLPHVNWQIASENHWEDGVLSIAVILPFNLDANSVAETQTQMRSVEFYKGVLMAVDEIQQMGQRVQVMAFDTESDPLYSILGNPQLLKADLLFCPMNETDVRRVADWGEDRHVPVISPFISSEDIVSDHNYFFQVNIPKSQLYPQVAKELLTRFSDYTFIFLSDRSKTDVKVDPFAIYLKQAIKEKKLSCRDYAYRSSFEIMHCDSLMGLENEDLFFIPNTSSDDVMRRMLSGLQNAKNDRAARWDDTLSMADSLVTRRAPRLAVFGYPEWVLHRQDYINYYYDLNVYLFTKVYANPFDRKLKKFYSAFKKWYGKEPMDLQPKYGLLGYDVARFFLQTYVKEGAGITKKESLETTNGLQNAFHLAHPEKGKGFSNFGCYLVHFTPSSTIDRIMIE